MVFLATYIEENMARLNVLVKYAVRIVLKSFIIILKVTYLLGKK